ncbi:lytic transglycosylase domain-containing protein [Candidatus Pacearchaeota archaeon]|nr:lytic transglycosylase domain-containing protein [Candidatus Pacearchaeota archaeon]
MIKLIIYAAIIFFLLLAWKEAHAYTPDQWIVLYQRDCQTVKENQACKQNLEKTLSRAFANRLMVLYYLKKHNIPSWLATVPIIESRYTSDAKSYTKPEPPKESIILAVGLWQFVKSTAIEYGLHDRENPVESTKSACRLLNHLYEKYNDWELALMAYNAGETRIDNYLLGSGPPLKPQTLNYYPQLKALQKIIEDISTGSNKYGFKPKSTKTQFKRYILYALFLK